VTESQKEIYQLLHLKYGRWKLADRRATESASTTLPPFVDLTIKLDVDDLADDFINDYYGNDDYIKVVKRRNLHQLSIKQACL
jgi:hypothetical protein